MIRDVHLYGVIGKRFGRHFRLDIHSPAEAVRALCALRPGFRETLREGYWRVIVGPPRYDNAIPVSDLNMSLGAQAIHIVPATQPRGDTGSILTVAAGVLIVAAAVVLSPFTAGASLSAGLAAMSSIGLTYGGIAMVGVALIATGVAGLLTPTPQTQPGQQATDLAPAPGDRPSFFFQGVTNNSQQGGPVPLVFGTHLTGSVVVSAAIFNQSIG
jgi:predicted phage tail protein